jgi:hypothetical protein
MENLNEQTMQHASRRWEIYKSYSEIIRNKPFERAMRRWDNNIKIGLE